MTSEKMTITIPIMFFDHWMKDMPEIKTRERKGKIRLRDANVLSWMDKPENSAVITVMVLQEILQECIRRGIIIYNPTKRTWRGVDYDGDGIFFSNESADSNTSGT